MHVRIRAIILGLLALLAAPALAVDGIDQPGKDYAHFPAPSASTCRHSCGGEAECQAYTWVKPGFQGPAAQCYLKRAQPALVKSPCCDSGPRNFIKPADLTAEDQTDRPGFDFKNFDSAGWKDCQATCAGNAACSSWSYARPGVQGPSGRCWLKNKVGRPVVNAGVISGVKYRPASVPFD